MPNDEALGVRKTMVVLVIVAGCFAVLWPRMLYPLLLGTISRGSSESAYETGCCEVMFESEVAYLELINEVCQSALGADGKLSPYAAANCRRAVNETCGVDIAAFLKRNENVGKTSRMLLETLRNSNSSCLKENFGVHVLSLSSHTPLNCWTQGFDTLKQERPPHHQRAGPHPALMERGRAIPPSSPTENRIVMPAHIRVRPSPLSVYYDLDIKPPPIPGMRPPLGSAGGKVVPPRSAMSVIMPLYTLVIIVFFAYTLSKILFKGGSRGSYEHMAPDPQFRRRVFRDDSRSSPDTRFGRAERDTVVSAISGLVAEVRQQMEAGYAQNQQSRPYTNGNVTKTPPVKIIVADYKEPSKDKLETINEPFTPEINDLVPEIKKVSQDSKEPKTDQTELNSLLEEIKLEEAFNVTEIIPQKELTPEPKGLTPEPNTTSPEIEVTNKLDMTTELTSKNKEQMPEPKDQTPERDEISPEPEDLIADSREPSPEEDISSESRELSPELKELKTELQKTLEVAANKEDIIRRVAEEFLDELKGPQEVEEDGEEGEEDGEEEGEVEDGIEKKQSTPELIADAVKEDSDGDAEEEEEMDNSAVKVVGMESRCHVSDGGAWPLPASPAPPPRPRSRDEVKSIYLDTEIPEQSSVLIADCASGRASSPPTRKHSSLVVSGKMTLSLIQDAPRETPDRDLESTLDEFTTASAMTHPNGDDKEVEDEEEYSEEEIEVEEIEEEISEEEIEE